MVLTYAIAIVVVLLLCGIGLSIGLILRGKGLQTCGRVIGPDGEYISCPSCGGRRKDNCEHDGQSPVNDKAE
jgi:hypothetical protein